MELARWGISEAGLIMYSDWRNPEMKQKLTRGRNYIMPVIRILLLALYLFSFTYGRFFISIFFFALSIIDVFRKKAGMVFFDLSIAFVLGIAMNPALIFYYETEKLRFYFLESQYQQAAQNTLDALADGTEPERIATKYRFLCDSSISCHKNGESVMVLFPTEITGNVTGYAYCFDGSSFQMLDVFDYYEKINEHWSVFKMYPLKPTEGQPAKAGP